MRSNRTTPFLVVLALLASLLAGLSIGGGGPVGLIRGLYNRVARLGITAVQPTPTPTVTPQGAAADPPTAQPSATPPPPATPTVPPATATAEPTARPTETVEPTATDEPTLPVTVQARVNVRAAPSEGGEVLTVLTAGTVATAVGRASDNQWLRIRTAEGVEGWITALPTLVTVTGEIARLPVIE